MFSSKTRKSPEVVQVPPRMMNQPNCKQGHHPPSALAHFWLLKIGPLLNHYVWGRPLPTQGPPGIMGWVVLLAKNKVSLAMKLLLILQWLQQHLLCCISCNKVVMIHTTVWAMIPYFFSDKCDTKPSLEHECVQDGKHWHHQVWYLTWDYHRV